MFTFEVKDMTCNHCAAAITRAVTEVDPAAQVRVDLGQSRVTVESKGADQSRIGAAITEAGYTPVALP